MNPFFYHPIQFQEAVKKELVRHRNQHHIEVTNVTLWVDSFLEKLSHTSVDLYPQLFAPLRRHQLHILMQHIPTLYSTPKFQMLLRGLLTRKNSLIPDGLWALLGHYCKLQELIEVLTHLQTIQPWPALTKASLPTLPSPLKNADIIAQTLAKNYSDSAFVWLDFVKQLKALSPQTLPDRWQDLPLGQHILRELLLNKTSVYSREIPAYLLQWIKTLISAQQLPIIAYRYLTTIPLKDWSPDILRFLVQKLGDPRRSPENWSSLPPDILYALIRWINTEKLSSFFLHGAQDSERYEFWYEFVDDMGPDSEGYIAYGQALFEFPGFGVVEFKDIGNAAYIYPIDIYRQFYRRAPTRLNDTLKNRAVVLYFDRQEMRIIHMNNWQYRWRIRIRELIQKGRLGHLTESKTLSYSHSFGLFSQRGNNKNTS